MSTCLRGNVFAQHLSSRMRSRRVAQQRPPHARQLLLSCTTRRRPCIGIASTQAHRQGTACLVVGKSQRAPVSRMTSSCFSDSSSESGSVMYGSSLLLLNTVRGSAPNILIEAAWESGGRA